MRRDVKSENVQIETNLVDKADVAAAAQRLATQTAALDQMMEQTAQFYHCGFELRAAHNDFVVWFELSPNGEAALTAPDFEIEIKRMLQAHL